MKLISCHVENFGKLHDCSMKFEDGINAVCKENGWGKSTFAAFIRAMFYGLDGDRKRSVEENERKRYKPWQGGVFGGRLIFETEGKQYEIQRIFHDKEANDEFELRDARTNLVSRDFTERIGEELFQIGRESFIRTIFIGQSECETYATDDINAKIGNITDNTNDMNHFDSANAVLTDLMNRMSPTRKTGSISKRKDEIAKLERVVKDGSNISKSVDEYSKMLRNEEEQYKVKKEEMQKNTALQKKAAALHNVQAKKDEWNHLKKSVEEKKKKATEWKDKFPGEIPENGEVMEMLSECTEYEKAAERVRMTVVSEEEQKELADLDDLFASGVPDETIIDEKIAATARYVRMKQEYSEKQLSAQEMERLEELETFFEKDTDSVSAIVGKWNERNARKSALPSKQAMLSAFQASAQVSSKSTISLWIIAGILAIVCGFFLLVKDLLLPGIGVAVIGIGLIIAGVLIVDKRKESGEHLEQLQMAELEKDIQEDREFVEKTDREVSIYLSAHGKEFEEYAVAAFLQQITEISVEYQTLKEKAKRAALELEREELEKAKKEISSFLCQFRLGEEDTRYLDDLYTLKRKREQYTALTQQERRNKKAKQEKAELEAEIVDFLERHGYSKEDNLREQMNEIQENLRHYMHASENKEEALRTLAKFEEEYDVRILEKETETADLPSLEDINATITTLTGEMEMIHKTITDYNKTLESLQSEYDAWQEEGIRLEQLQELQEKEQKKYQYLKKVQEKLCAAKESITSKYSAPILKAFGNYYSMITGEKTEVFHLDANTTITVDEFGKQRQVNTLSTGYRDLIGICLRVALVDAMYENEAPILIFDDPFTHLDDEKMKSATIFMENVARHYQILYFTCSNIRNMER